MNIDFLRTAVKGGDFSDDVCAKLLVMLNEVEKLREELKKARKVGTELAEIDKAFDEALPEALYERLSNPQSTEARDCLDDIVWQRRQILYGNTAA